MKKLLTVTFVMVFVLGLASVAGAFPEGGSVGQPYDEAFTLIEGNIKEDTTLTKSDSPYIIKGDLQVFDDVVLTIEEGVIIEIDENVSINVAGSLILEGKEDEPVILTSKSSNKWEGIVFINSNSSIKNTIIENANRAISYEGICMVIIDNNIFQNNGCIITDSGGYQEMSFINNTVLNNKDVFSGIRTSGTSIFKNNIFKYNDSVFPHGYYFGETIISENNFIDNDFIIKAPAEGYGYGTVDISNNWWGTTDLSFIENNLVKDKNDDVSLQLLDYKPIKTTEIQGIGSSIKFTFHGLTIEVEGQGATTPSEGMHAYYEGKKVELEATAAEGWEFDKWSINGENVEEAATTVIMGTDKTATSYFSDITSDIKVERISGADRFETAVEISQEGWTSSDTVIIARSDDFPDALAGTPLAYQEDAPILLTPTESLSSTTRTEIERLGADKAIILGGTAAVSDTVENELLAMGLEVERIGGENRYETASLIAENLPEADQAILAYGGNFPDALAIGPYAAQKGYPILLARTESIPSATEEILTGINNTIIVGGTAVIGNNVFEQAPSPTRIAGEDRFDTASKIVSQLDLPVDKAYVATGMNFADALTGSALAAKDNASMLLVRQNAVPSATKGIIDQKGISYFIILGGTGAVSGTVELQLKDEEKIVDPR